MLYTSKFLSLSAGFFNIALSDRSASTTVSYYDTNSSQYAIRQDPNPTCAFSIGESVLLYDAGADTVFKITFETGCSPSSRVTQTSHTSQTTYESQMENQQAKRLCPFVIEPEQSDKWFVRGNLDARKCVAKDIDFRVAGNTKYPMKKDGTSIKLTATFQRSVVGGFMMIRWTDASGIAAPKAELTNGEYKVVASRATYALNHWKELSGGLQDYNNEIVEITNEVDANGNLTGEIKKDVSGTRGTVLRVSNMFNIVVEEDEVEKQGFWPSAAQIALNGTEPTEWNYFDTQNRGNSTHPIYYDPDSGIAYNGTTHEL